ncbi:DMT family transporter [Streptomyces sp. NPDC014986]|uniref:DMT family transporter n=1 Tax=Streptomyces sp. NPDC014986 TaxID=3364934 RepID=UPI0036FF3284
MRPAHLLLAVLVAAVWGVNFTVIEIGLGHFPPLLFSALRGLDRQGAGTVLFVAWVATVFGFGARGWLLRRHPASTVAPFSLLVPVFGMSSAALFLGESVTPLRWCAAALLTGGVALASVTPRRPAPEPAVPNRLEQPPTPQGAERRPPL